MNLHLIVRPEMVRGPLTTNEQAREVADLVVSTIHEHARSTWPILRQAVLSGGLLFLDVDTLGDEGVAAARAATYTLSTRALYVRVADAWED